MIYRLEIENFRTFRKNVLNFERNNVIIGPNSSGKSNLCTANTHGWTKTKRQIDIPHWKEILEGDTLGELWYSNMLGGTPQ